MKNVVLLTVDALRADHLSCYGYHRETSPFLSALADSGTLFSVAFSTSSHTREAIPSMLSGHYPSAAVSSGYTLRKATIGSILENTGVRTAAFHSNPFVSRAYGFGNGFDHFDDDLRLSNYRVVALAQRLWDKVRNRHYARGSDINERSLNWLDNGGEPFFLWNHYMDAHGPYEPPSEYRTAFYDGAISDRKAQQLYKRAIDSPDDISDSERQTLIDLYDGEIRYIDERLQEFVREIERRELDYDTLFIITADHGDAFGEHGYYEHPRRLHDELTRIPLLLSPMDSTRIDVPVSLLDIVPTILQALNVKSDRNFPGVPLQDIVATPENYRGRAVISEVRELKQTERRRFRVRDQHEALCYETSVDNPSFPEQDTDLATTLTDHMQRLQNQSPSATGEDTEPADSERVSHRLEALGYKE